MIRFSCFNCNVKLEMEEKYVGRRGRCPKCKAKNTIPSPNDTLEDSIMILFNDIDENEEENSQDKYELLDE